MSLVVHLFMLMNYDSDIVTMKKKTVLLSLFHIDVNITSKSLDIVLYSCVNRSYQLFKDADMKNDIPYKIIAKQCFKLVYHWR